MIREKRKPGDKETRTGKEKVEDAALVKYGAGLVAEVPPRNLCWGKASAGRKDEI